MAEPGTSTLPDTLGTLPERVGRFVTPSSVEQRGAAARKEIPALMREKREAAAEQEGLEFQRDQGVLRRTADAERDVARGTRMEAQRLDTGLQQRETFEAPEYKASDYAKNSATRLLSAVLLGGIAKTSAKGQLQAIKSMQDAEERGLMNEFDAARTRFDEQEKSRVDNNKMLKDRFDRMIDLLGKDRNAALVEAKLIEGQLGQGIIATKLRAGLLTDAYDLAQKAFESGDRAAIQRAKPSARGAAGVSPSGMGTPGFTSDIVLHPSGVPLAQINIFENLSGKALDDQRKEEATLARPVRQKLVEETNKARTTRSDMDRAEQALKNMEKKGGQLTGGIYGLPFGIGGVMQDIRTSQDPDAASFRTVAAAMQRNAYVPGEGQISNFERQLFAQANLDLGRPMQTNFDLIKANRIAADRLVERAKFFDRYFTVNRTLSGADEFWEQFIENNPILIRNEKGEIVSNPKRVDSYVDYFKSIAGRRGGNGGQAATSNASQTVTMEDIEFTAQQRNMSVEDVIKEARNRGLQIEDE